MKKKRKQLKKLQKFRSNSLLKSELVGIRGGDCCGSGDGEGHPPDPPKTMAAAITIWGS